MTQLEKPDAARGERLVKIASLRTEWEALILVNRLRDAGIAATAIGVHTAGFLAEAPGEVGVLVDQVDVEHATNVINHH